MRKVVRFNKGLSKIIANDAKNSTYFGVHIIPSMTRGWNVVMDGSTSAIKKFIEKESAIYYAKHRFQKEKNRKIIIHNLDGKIEFATKSTRHSAV